LALMTLFRWWYTSQPMTMASEKDAAPVGRIMNSWNASFLGLSLQVHGMSVEVEIPPKAIDFWIATTICGRTLPDETFTIQSPAGVDEA
jgi:hypothetical protein